mmetsp:Transcript_29939/g.39800  ORF Transcript_29939/g.39800 Transcript_29939/m.39800 type:complete len:92 (+) Transcript_29939:18-293(+)
MEKCPFTFDSKNPRLVKDAATPGAVYTAAGVLFLASISLYNKRFFRIDQNAANMVAFTLASAPASFAYANYFLNDAETEAAVLNNSRETQM